MSTKDKNSKYDLSTLNKVTHPTKNILRAQNHITAIITNYPCDATKSGAYGHSFLIYSDNVWLTKDVIATAVTINKPETFTRSTYASRYAYYDKLKMCSDMNKH